MAVTEATTSRGFTPKSIEALKPRPTHYELADPGCSGLILRVMASGVRSFRWYVRSLDKVVTIGPWSMEPAPGHVTLKQAREWLDRLKAARLGGPGQLAQVVAELERFKAPLPAPAPVAPSVLVKDVIDEFYERRLLPQRKRPKEARALLDKDLVPKLGHLPISWFDTNPKEARRLCADLVAGVVQRGAPTWAGKVLGMLKQFFLYCEAQGHLDRSPAAALKADNLGVENNSRERWLSAEEIPLFWAALNDEEPRQVIERVNYRTGKVQLYLQRVPSLTLATRAGLRVLLLTGVRSCELLLARWEDVDLKAATWTIPVANQKLTPKQAKKAKPFVIPLAPSALALFKVLQAEAALVKDADGKPLPWVMASDESDLGHFTYRALGRAMQRLFEGKEPALVLPGGPASPHDLRRTMRTQLGKLGVLPHISERCLNHSLGHIEKTYDRGDYLEERRAALEKWAAYVERLVSPATASVTFLAGGARP